MSTIKAHDEIREGKFERETILKAFRYCPACLKVCLEEGVDIVEGAAKEIYSDVLKILEAGGGKKELSAYLN